MQFGLAKRGMYRRGDKWNAKVLNIWDSKDEFKHFHFKQEERQSGGGRAVAALFSKHNAGSSNGACLVSTGTPIRPSDAVLPRPRSHYNRFVFHAVASILYMFDDEFLKQQCDFDLGADLNRAQQMLTVEYMTQFRDRSLIPEINWMKIMITLAFIGGLSYQCMNAQQANLIDQIAERVERIFFAELINPWLAEHGGWVCIFSSFFPISYAYHFIHNTLL